MSGFMLVGFSQDYSFVSKDEYTHFLVFKRENGTTFRLPVTKAAVEELIHQTMVQETVNGPEKTAEESESVGLEQATEFGGDEPEESFEEPEDESYPESEEEVPSL